MPENFLSLIANRDFSNVSSASPIVNYLVKPMSFEFKIAQVVIMNMRRERLRELLEQEREEQEEGLRQLKKSSTRTRVCQICGIFGTRMDMNI